MAGDAREADAMGDAMGLFPEHFRLASGAIELMPADFESGEEQMAKQGGVCVYSDDHTLQSSPGTGNHLQLPPLRAFTP
jgi:hypothetical protein